jgi:hypothetical protein
MYEIFFAIGAVFDFALFVHGGTRRPHLSGIVFMLIIPAIGRLHQRINHVLALQSCRPTHRRHRV